MPIPRGRMGLNMNGIIPGLRKGWYTGAVYSKYTARNVKIQIHVTAYARHVFLEYVQREYGRPSSVAAGAYRSGSE